VAHQILSAISEGGATGFQSSVMGIGNGGKGLLNFHSSICREYELNSVLTGGYNRRQDGLRKDLLAGEAIWRKGTTLLQSLLGSTGTKTLPLFRFRGTVGRKGHPKRIIGGSSKCRKRKL